jgi:two-component system CheB/CheR fusion protein
MFQQQEQGTRRTHPGLGIGLALVKQLTEAHGGSVVVASDGPGCGTVVTMHWPLTLIPEAPLLVADGSERALNGLRILVVEDMEDSREVICVMLERFGAIVTTARDGIEALERASCDDVDVILCDLRMPNMDGFEFLRALNRIEDRRHPPVIALSGLASSADHLATQAAGFTGHVDKPVNDGPLVAAVRVAIALRSTSTCARPA